MKKLPFLMVIFLLVVSYETANAQIVNSIGIRAGWATTFPDVEQLINAQPVEDEIYNRNMLYPELQVELFSYKHFSLLTNFSYISKGFDYWDSWGGWVSGSGRFAAEIDYLTISTSPKFSWKVNNITLYGFAGPYFGIRNGYAEYFIDALWFMPVGQEARFLKSTIYGGTLGAGIEFKGKSKKLSQSVQLQYMHDFTTAADFTQSPIDYYGYYFDYRFKAKFQTLLLSYGIHYTFKQKED